MQSLYLDIFSGISGDMFLGALIDLGVDVATLEDELRKLNLPGYRLHCHRAQKSHIAGTKFDVLIDPPPPTRHDHHARKHEHRTFATIRDLIRHSTLSPWVQNRAIAVFERIARAEGTIHGLPPDQVHFHEVGALDSIIDIVGACIALDLLGRPRVLSGPVVEGTGFLQCAHGRYPLPGPATLAILSERHIPITQCDEPHELITPTGAALLAEFAESFAPLHHCAPQRIGFGLGTRDNRTRPNTLRAILADTLQTHGTQHDWETDQILVLETNLDDLSAEILGHFIDRALTAGALDVFHTPIQMKKSRPGILLTVLAHPDQADSLTELILRETSAFGVRRTLAERRKLRRESVPSTTPWGAVAVKLGRLNGQIVQAAPEYEDCRRLATEVGIPVKQVYEAALRGLPKPPATH